MDSRVLIEESVCGADIHLFKPAVEHADDSLCLTIASRFLECCDLQCTQAIIVGNLFSHAVYVFWSAMVIWTGLQSTAWTRLQQAAADSSRTGRQQERVVVFPIPWMDASAASVTASTTALGPLLIHLLDYTPLPSFDPDEI